MVSEWVRSVKVTLLLAVLLCGFYPALVWMVGKAAFPDQASGGMIYKDGKAIGAKLIGQSFSKPEYFQGRPSAAGNGYDASASSGSNLGPTNKKLADRLSSDVERLLKENPELVKGQIPVNLVTASGSGLDPHISPEAAAIQVPRVAKARGLSPEKVADLVRIHTDGPQWGVFGEPTINVLALNLALDKIGK